MRSELDFDEHAGNTLAKVDLKPTLALAFSNDHHTNKGHKSRVQCRDLSALLSAAQVQHRETQALPLWHEDSANKPLEGETACHDV